MLDRRGKLDDQIIQSSWIEMKSILDEEMPVGNSKRRILFFLLFLVGVLGGGYWINSHYSNNSIDANITTKHSVVHSEDQHDKQVTESFPEMEVTENTGSAQSSGVNQLASGLDESADKISSTIIQQSNDSEKITSTDVRIVESSKPGIQFSGNLEKIIATGKKGEIQSNDIADVDNMDLKTLKESPAEPLRKVIEETYVDFLDHRSFYIDLPFTLFERSSFDLARKTEPIVSTPNPPGLFAYTESRVIDYQSFNNNFGIGIEWHPRQLMIEGNIGYGIDRYIEERSVVNSLGNRFTGDLATENNLLATINSRSLEKGNYFSLGSVIGYRITQKLSLFGKVNYRIYALNVTNDQAFVAAESDASSPNQAGGDAEVAYQLNFMPENDLYLGVGIGYAITRKLSARASYMIQMNDPFRVEIPNLGVKLSNEVLVRRKELRLGLKYRF